MKFLILLLVSLNAFAGEKNDGKLTCKLDSPTAEIVINDRLTFVPHDSFSVTSFDGLAVKGFLDENEKSMGIITSSLSLQFAPNSCVLNKEGEEIARCHYVDDKKKLPLNFSSINFSYGGESSTGAAQRITVWRSLRFMSADLVIQVVPKQNQNRAVLTLTAEAKVGNEVRSLKLQKDLGEWTDKVDRSDWDRCLMTP